MSKHCEVNTLFCVSCAGGVGESWSRSGVVGLPGEPSRKSAWSGRSSWPGWRPSTRGPCTSLVSSIATVSGWSDNLKRTRMCLTLYMQAMVYGEEELAGGEVDTCGREKLLPDWWSLLERSWPWREQKVWKYRFFLCPDLQKIIQVRTEGRRSGLTLMGASNRSIQIPN